MTQSNAAHTPQRMCIASRRLFPASELLRVVVDPADASRIIADPAAVLPGRGAWIQPSLAHYELACKRRSFARALRVSASVDTQPVRTYIASLGEPKGSPQSQCEQRDDTEGRFEH
nr:YlxR family protein [Corynebacterium sp. 11A]